VYISKVNLVDYDTIVDSSVSKVYSTYYTEKVRVLNEAISHVNSLIELDSK